MSGIPDKMLNRPKSFVIRKPTSLAPLHAILWAVLSISLIVPATSHARLGDSVEQLAEKYGKPFSTETMGGYSTILSKSGDFAILSFFEAGVVKFELILPAPDPQAVVTAIAGDGTVAPIPTEKIYKWSENGTIPEGFVAGWFITNRSVSFALYGRSENGGYVAFANKPADFFDLVKAMNSKSTEGL